MALEFEMCKDGCDGYLEISLLGVAICICVVVAFLLYFCAFHLVGWCCTHTISAQYCCIILLCSGLQELLPGILPQLGADGLDQLRKLHSMFGNAGAAGGAADDDDDDVPELGMYTHTCIIHTHVIHYITFPHLCVDALCGPWRCRCVGPIINCSTIMRGVACKLYQRGGFA